MKIRVVIKTTQTTVLDIGDLPIGLVRDLLQKNDGSFDGNWSMYDTGMPSDVTDSVEVEPA